MKKCNEKKSKNSVNCKKVTRKRQKTKRIQKNVENEKIWRKEQKIR